MTPPPAATADPVRAAAPPPEPFLETGPDEAAAGTDAAEPESLASLESQADASPTDPEVQRRFALGLAREGRGTEAAERLDRAEALSRASADSLLNVGAAWSQLGRPERAEAAYEAALAVSPKHAVAWNNLGNCAMRRGDKDRGIRCYRLAVGADPRYVMAWYRMATSLKFYGDDAEAEAAYRRVLILDPKNDAERDAQIDARCQLASIALRRGEVANAEMLLADAVREAPGGSSAHFSHAQALIRQGRDAEAQAELAAHHEVVAAGRATGTTRSTQ